MRHAPGGNAPTWYCERCDVDVAFDSFGTDAVHSGPAGGCGGPVVALPDMYALTLWAPWWWAITDLPMPHRKQIENRPWAPYPWVLQRWFALHANAVWADAGMHTIMDITGLAKPPDWQAIRRQAGTLVGLVRVDHYWAPGNMLDGGGGAWRFAGEYGWAIGDVIKLDPVRVPRGWNKLWKVPAPARWRVLQQLQVVRPDVVPLLATPRKPAGGGRKQPVRATRPTSPQLLLP